MNYIFLLEQIKKHGYSVTSMSKEIGMSQVGLKQSIDRKSLRVDKLEKIAAKLSIPIYEFFEKKSNQSDLKVIIAHKSDGSGKYDEDLFYYYKDLLTELVRKNRDLWQKGTGFIVEYENEDPTLYVIEEIIIGQKVINIYFDDYLR